VSGVKPVVRRKVVDRYFASVPVSSFLIHLQYLPLMELC